jgi:hypothetical protein
VVGNYIKKIRSVALLALDRVRMRLTKDILGNFGALPESADTRLCDAE